MDPEQSQHVAAMAAGFMGIFALFGIVILAFAIFVLWRIFTKAGLAGPLSLLVIIPGFGWIIVLCILAFSEWKVAPIAAAIYYPPPPPPAYPTAAPPAQL